MTIPYRPVVTFGRPPIDIGRDGCVTVLRLLKNGWERTLNRPVMHPDTGEVEVTECLRDGMREALKYDVVPLSKQITIFPGAESRSIPRVLRPDGRTDIPIYFQRIREEYDEHDPHAIVECKRVSGSSADLWREYVVNGMDRFRDGKYAGDHAGRLHGRVPVVWHCRCRGQANQPVLDPQETPARTSGSIRRSQGTLGADQSSSPTGASHVCHPAPRFLRLSTSTSLSPPR